MATTDSVCGAPKPQTIESSSQELRNFLYNLKYDIETFLGKDKPECKSPNVPPVPNPITSVMDNLSEARGIVGDIRSLVFSDIAHRIRES